MSEIGRPFSEGLFDFSGRRNRLSYFLVSLALLGVLLFSALIIGNAFDSPAAAEDAFIFLGIGAIVAAWINLSITAQRLKDIGLSPWWLVAVVACWAIPIVGLIASILLLVCPGKEGHSVYGPDPLEVDTAKATGDNQNPSSPSSLTAPHSDRGDGQTQARPKPQIGTSNRESIKAEIRGTKPNDSRLSSEPVSSHDAPENDEQDYLAAYDELKSGKIDRGLWIKCLTLESGDKEKAKFQYIKQRVAQKKEQVSAAVHKAEATSTEEPSPVPERDDDPHWKWRCSICGGAVKANYGTTDNLICRHCAHQSKNEQGQESLPERESPTTRRNPSSRTRRDAETIAFDAGLTKDQIEYLGRPINEFDYMKRYKVSKRKLHKAIKMGRIRSVVCDGELWLQDAWFS